MWKCLIVLIFIGIGCSNETKQIEEANTENKSTVNFDDLLKGFNNKETKDRQNILYELNQQKYPEIKSLLEIALDDESEFVRIIAIQSIKDNMQIESLEKLISMFNESDNHTIISNLCRTFVEFQKRKPILSIVKKLESKNEMIVYSCIWTLGEIGDKSEIDLLKQFTSNPNVPEIYDDEGFLSQTTQFSIGEIANKSIEKIRIREVSK